MYWRAKLILAQCHTVWSKQATAELYAADAIARASRFHGLKTSRFSACAHAQ
jgi:hypothetical protein